MCYRPVDVVGSPGFCRVMSSDHAVRMFMTGYTPDAEVVEQQKGDTVAPQAGWADAMIRRRIRNLVDDLHCGIAQFLCSSYNLAILLKFETQQMVTGRGRRRIGSKMARAKPLGPTTGSSDAFSTKQGSTRGAEFCWSARRTQAKHAEHVGV
ncbi:hypothetical protein V1522DRAFT_401932 [Lipomyces starkeyi]